MVGHKSYAAKLMQEIVENGKYKNLNDIKAALSKEGFQIDSKMKVFDWLMTLNFKHQKENFSKFETMEGFQAYYEPFPYGAFPRAPTSDEVRKCEALCRGEIKKRYLWTINREFITDVRRQKSRDP